MGAQKCGTTSLAHYLSQHPMVCASKPKETDFFSYDRLYSKGSKWYYRNAFPTHNKEKILLDSSVEYLYIPYVAKRIFDYNPDSKIIICKRDPIDRFFSAYNMYKALSEGKLWLDLYLIHLENHNEFMNNRMLKVLEFDKYPSPEFFFEWEMSLIERADFHYEPSFLSRGLYNIQINRFEELFGKQNILILEFERIKSQTIEVLNEICTFLGISKHVKYDLTPQLVGKNITTPKQMLKQMLIKFYEPKK